MKGSKKEHAVHCLSGQKFNPPVSMKMNISLPLMTHRRMRWVKNEVNGQINHFADQKGN